MANLTEIKAPQSASSSAARSRRLLWIAAGLAVAWFVAAEAATFFWYSSHESKLPKNQLPASGEIVLDRLKKRVEAAGGVFKEQEIGDAAMEMLKCSFGRTLIWRGPDGAPMAVTAIRWSDRSIVGGVESMHNPGVCLRAAGWEIGEKTEFGVEDYCGANAEVTQWEVSQGGQRMMAYSAVFRRFAGEIAKDQTKFWNSKRFDSVLTGRRDAPVMILLAYLPVSDFGDSSTGHDRFGQIMKDVFCPAAP